MRCYVELGNMLSSFPICLCVAEPSLDYPNGKFSVFSVQASSSLGHLALRAVICSFAASLERGPHQSWVKLGDGDAAAARRAPACSWRWNTGVRRASAGLREWQPFQDPALDKPMRHPLTSVNAQLTQGCVWCRDRCMRTNIVLDDELVRAAMQY